MVYPKKCIFRHKFPPTPVYGGNLTDRVGGRQVWWKRGMAITSEIKKVSANVLHRFRIGSKGKSHGRADYETLRSLVVKTIV